MDLTAFLNLASPEPVAQDVVAAANPEAALSIIEALKSRLGSALADIKPDFNYDAGDKKLHGVSEDYISFPCRPDLFVSNGIIGTLSIQIHLSPPVKGSGPQLANTSTQGSTEVGFYFKRPAKPDLGKFQMEQSAGALDIKFDENGTPTFPNPTQIGNIAQTIRSVSQEVFKNPPEGAKSEAKSREELRTIRDQNLEAERYKKEKEREDQQAAAYKAQRDADKATHGSPQLFADYMTSIDEPAFGPRDLDKVLNTMFPDQGSRKMSRELIRQEIIGEGLEWDHKKVTVSSARPRANRINLLKIASRVAFSGG